jgi:hypothetical protein
MGDDNAAEDDDFARMVRFFHLLDSVSDADCQLQAEMEGDDE